MKIVHLIDYFQPKVGYQEYFLAREHQRCGHEVYVVTSNRYFPFPNYKETYKKILGKRILNPGTKIEEGVRTIRLRSFEIPCSNLVILLGLRKVLLQIKPDIVFCHGVYSLTSYRIACFKQFFGFKLIFDTHAASFNTNFNRSLLTRLYHFFFKIVIMPKIKKEKDGIFAIGEEEQKFLEEDFNFSRRSIPIIRCGVDTGKFFFSPAQRKKIRRNLKISKKEIVIVYAGKITPNKELEILFQAVSLLKFFNIRLLIIGGGPEGYFKKLEKIKSKGVIRLSFLENKDLSSYFSASDIGVWPGDPSVALLEAMACRLPVILPESVETQYLEESNGIMRFKRGNAKDLAEKIKLLVFDENLRKKFGKNGEKFIRDELSWQKIGKKTLNLVKNLKKSRNY